MTRVEYESVSKNGNSTTAIVAISASIVAVLLLGFCAKAVYARMHADELEQQAVKARQEQIYMTKIRDRKLTKGKVDEIDGVIDHVRSSTLNAFDTAHKLDVSGGEELEAQYDPRHDFAVFGVGNGRLGGTQTLQEKMNLADESSAEEGDAADDSESEPAKQGTNHVAAGEAQDTASAARSDLTRVSPGLVGAKGLAVAPEDSEA